MPEGLLAPLAGWESYYVIVGSSAAALTGLQFVVIALVAEVSQRSTDEQINAFATPSIVHFCVALLTSATLSAPWRSLSSLAIAIGATGLAGLFYSAIVIRRARRQKGYEPVFEDWLWHAILPVVAYAAHIAAAVALPANTAPALFVVGAATLLLVFIGIHNAWDTVTFIAVTRLKANAEGVVREADAPDSPPPPTPETRP